MPRPGVRFQAIDYADARERMLPLDMLGFSGKGDTSNIIKVVTRSPVSHVAIVTRKALPGPSGILPGTLVEFIESTSMRGANGVREGRVSELLHPQHGYDGVVWWCPLSQEARQRLDLAAAYDWLYRQRGKKYDFRQAVKAGLDRLDCIPFSPTLTAEDFSKLFCSELGAEVLERGKVIGPVNSSEVTPAELLSWDIFARTCYQLTPGPLVEIPRYASRPAP